MDVYRKSCKRIINIIYVSLLTTFLIVIGELSAGIDENRPGAEGRMIVGQGHGM